MSKKVFFLPAVLFTLLLTTGAGCLSFKTNDVSSIGGMWLTKDAGVKWESKSILPTVDGLSSITASDITVIAFDPSDAEAMYIGTRENGLLYSYDNGETWMRVKDADLREGKIEDIAVDPKDKCTIYVSKGKNVFKSTDCSRTWDTEMFVEANAKTVRTITLDWYNSNVVWIGTDAGDIVRSSDGGSTWSTMERVKDEVADIMVDNSDSRIVMATTEGKGLWRSTDTGVTWVRLSEELEDFDGAEKGSKLVEDNSGTIMYFANDYGILKSVDHGASWQALVLVTKPRSVKVLSLAVNPNDGNAVSYGTATTFYTSTDGGTNWTTRELPTTRTASALSFDPNDATVLFMGSAELEK